MADTLTLQLTPVDVAGRADAGWSVSAYSLAGPARGKPGPTIEVNIDIDSILELELNDGSRLLAAAADAERYLGPAIARDGDPAASNRVIRVGTTFRPSGLRPPPPARDGLAAWLLKALYIYEHGPAGMTALTAAGMFQDSQLEQRRGIYRLDGGSGMPVAPAAPPPSAEPLLMFIHGTGSSTAGSFADLWRSPAAATLNRNYGERIFGFEHRSLTDSPIANALELALGLPEAARLHLVSHSRGGMVAELLARAGRTDAPPFTEAEIERFLEHAEATGRTGFAREADLLRQLNAALIAKKPKIERLIRIAGPLRGTTLASGRLDRWASVMLNLLGAGIDVATAWTPAGEAAAATYAVLKNFLLAVVKTRGDARILPGLEAMTPDSPLVALLNTPGVAVDSPLHIIAGDYRGDSLLAWLGESVAESFYGSRTDLVVNTPSMSGGAERPRGSWRKTVSGPAVTHFSYFRRDDSVQPLLQALAGDNGLFLAVQPADAARPARAGATKAKPALPIALILPGVMGSELAADGDRIWFAPLRLIAGELSRLRIDAAKIAVAGWVGRSYDRFADFLGQSHEVRPCAYDWRLSLRDAAQQFGRTLDTALADARQRRQPVRIVAHSMGGLVARLALRERWPAFKDIPGSRLVQFGTPNQGSHSIAAVLTGRDRFVQLVEAWCDWRHDMKEFLDIVRDYPGILELLPWSQGGEPAGDGIDYFDGKTWENWAERDLENRRERDGATRFAPAPGAGAGWLPPRPASLEHARATIRALLDAPLDPAATCYVAGSGRTPVALRMVDGRMEIGWSEDGDGRVPYGSGIPPGVRAWYVDAAHGDLLREQPAFGDYLELLERGECRLPTMPRKARAPAAVFAPAPLAEPGFYPNPEEIVATALGERLPDPENGGGGERAISPVTVEVFHGSLAAAERPVMIGAYQNDSLAGSAHFLDRQLDGRLTQARTLGRYPAQPGDAQIFLQPERQRRPGGAVVVGLGPVGELEPGALVRALSQGMIEYIRTEAGATPAGAGEPAPLELSTLLVGTGFGGLSVDLGIQCLAEALRQTNRALALAGVGKRLERLSIFEEDEARATAAAEALRELAGNGRWRDAIRFDAIIRPADGGFRNRCASRTGFGGWHRVHIVTDPTGALRFTLMTDRARNEVSEEPDQRQAVDGLIRAATGSTQVQSGLARALFELMIPNGFKETLTSVRGIVLGVDAGAAVYPWEMMNDRAGADEKPLAARIGMVRQLASPHGRQRLATVARTRILAIADTDSGLDELRGAQIEGRTVAALFRERGYQAVTLERASGQTVLAHLFDGEYRVIHLAAHGTVADQEGAPTGMVLDRNTYLTTAQISKLRQVPELVFLNCCHLGSMAADARPRWGKLAANLATEFIEMGCKAVVAAGWAVDDDAAGVFAGAFYRAMLAGSKFGDAVLAARAETWARYPATNTWGAYQAYGDERYRLLVDTEEAAEPLEYLHSGQVVCDLDRVRARLALVRGPEEIMYYRRQLEQIELAALANFFTAGAVRERLGAAWAELGEFPRAIDHCRAALAQEDGGASLHALEQLANLEIRQGMKLLRAGGDRAAGDAAMQSGLDRLELLLRLGTTAERQALLGGAWKRRTQALLEHEPRSRQARLDALEKMVAAYQAAISADHPGYALINLLDGAWLLARHGRPDRYRALAEYWRPRFAASAERAHGFFQASLAADIARIDALWAFDDGRNDQALDREPILDRVAERYRALFAVLGSVREQSSVFEQIEWLSAMLPPGKNHRPARTALNRLLQTIRPAP